MLSHLENNKLAEPPSNQADLMWLTGLLEGEGCFGNWPNECNANKRQLAIQLSMTDLDVVERAARLFGCKVHEQQPGGSSKKVAYRCRITDTRAAKFMVALLPFLGQRRRQKVEGILKYWIAQYI